MPITFSDSIAVMTGSLQESGLDDEAFHLYQLGQRLARKPEPEQFPTEVQRYLHESGVETTQDNPLAMTLMKFLEMAHAQSIGDAA